MAEDLTHKRVLQIAVPIVLSNATVPILGAVDAGVIGQIGEAAPIAAIGIGAMILSALYWIFGFLRMGTTGFAAQALGQGDKDGANRILSRAMIIALVGGLAIIALQVLLFRLAFMISPASAAAEDMARTYMQIRVWSAPAMIATFAINGWLIAAERTRAVMVIQFWMNGINIALDFWFVLGLNMGVAGVAVATVIAENTGALLGLWFCRDVFATDAWKDWARVFDRSKLKRFAQVNTDILTRSLMLQAIFMSFLFFGARFGDVTLASNHILLQFLSITAFALDGFAFAAEALVGKALGARSRSAFRQASAMCSVWGLAIGVALLVIFLVFGGPIIDLMTTAEDVRQVARTYLPYMVLAPVLGAGAWMLDGIFIGATRTRDLRDMMFVSMLIYFGLALPLMALWENHGLWIAFLISFIARGLTLWRRYPALEADLS